MRSNIELQIEMIENKIERLSIQKDFYERILKNENNNDNHRTDDSERNH